MKPLFATMTLIGALVAQTDGCGQSKAVKPSADMHQQRQTSQRLAEADRQVGMPDITSFTERKLARDILELRDKEITTYAYITNMHGELIFLGEAIGFGLPYSVQFTNPDKLIDAEQSLGIGLFEDNSRIQQTSQADPNGLFMPAGLSATWIMLKGPTGKIHPVYVEPQIIVSPFRLHAEKVPFITPIAAGGAPEITIELVDPDDAA